MTVSATGAPRRHAGTVISGAAGLSIARMASIVLQLAFTAILSRLIPPAQFGVFASASLIISLSLTVFDGSLSLPLLQRPRINPRRVGFAFGSGALISFVCVGLLWLVAPAYEAFIHVPEASEAIRFASLILLVKAPASVFSAVLQRRAKYWRLSLATLSASLLGSVLSVSAAYMGAGYRALIVGTLATACAELVLFGLQARPWPRPNLHAIYWSEFGARGGSFTAVQMLNWVALSAPNLMIARALGPMALGTYNRSWRLLDMINTATSSPLQRVLIPHVAEATRDPARVRSILARSLRAGWLVFLPIGVGGSIHAPAMVAIFLGEKWTSAVPVMSALLISFPARAIYKICDAQLYGMGRSLEPVIRQLIFAALTLAGTFIGLRTAGLVGAAAVVTCALVIYSIGIQARTLARIQLSVRDVAPGAAAAIAISAAAGLADYGVIRLHLLPHLLLDHLAGGLVFCAVYALLVAIMPPKVVGQDIARLRRKLISGLPRRAPA